MTKLATPFRAGLMGPDDKAKVDKSIAKPASSTSTALARWSGTDGDALLDSGWTLSSTNIMDANGRVLRNVIIDHYGLSTAGFGTRSGAVDIDVSTADYLYVAFNGNATITFANPLSVGYLTVFYLEVTNGGAYAITWPAGVNWDGSSPPELQASGVDLLCFASRDGGTTYRGFQVWGPA